MSKKPVAYSPLFKNGEYSETNESNSEREEQKVQQNRNNSSQEVKRPRLNLGSLRIHASAPKNAATGRKLVWNGENYVANENANSNNSENAGYEGNSNARKTRKSRKSRKSKSRKARK